MLDCCEHASDVCLNKFEAHWRRIMLGKFNSRTLANSFSNMTHKTSAIILGDDEKFWVVTLATMEKLLRAGYELAL